VRVARALLFALPGLALFVAGQFHPPHLTDATSHTWWTLHVTGLFVFPLVAVALVLLLRGRRDPVAVVVVLLAYVYATAYSALDVINGIGAGYVTWRLGPGQPRPDDLGSLFHIGTELGLWGSRALVAASVVVVLDALWRRRVWALPALVLVPGAYLVHVHHIFHPEGAAGMGLIGLATGWLAYLGGGPARQNSRSAGSSMPRSAS